MAQANTSEGRDTVYKDAQSLFGVDCRIRTPFHASGLKYLCPLLPLVWTSIIPQSEMHAVPSTLISMLSGFRLPCTTPR